VIRSAAAFAWGALLVLPLAFVGVSWAHREPASPAVTALVLWGAIAASAAAVVLSRAVPPRLRPSTAGREATALVRLLVAWSLCSGATLVALVALRLTADARLLAVAAVALVAHALLVPTDRRWREALPADEDELDVERRAAP
jgi:hypothetical protein